MQQKRRRGMDEKLPATYVARQSLLKRFKTADSERLDAAEKFDLL
jgi:hypothetical protein